MCIGTMKHHLICQTQEKDPNNLEGPQVARLPDSLSTDWSLMEKLLATEGT